jgi:hypothetical protein
MKDEIKREFEKAIADRQARDARAQEIAGRKVDQRRQAEEEWETKRNQVVAPALQEIEQMLKQSGWVTSIRDENGDLALDIYKGDMRSAGGGRERPNVRFRFDGSGVSTYLATTSVKKSGPTFDFAELTTQKVQEFVLDFFKQLTG